MTDNEQIQPTEYPSHWITKPNARPGLEALLGDNSPEGN